MRHGPSFPLALALVALVPLSALAQGGAPSIPVEPNAPASAPRSFHADLGAGTEFPASVGAMTAFEFPYRILLQLNVGFMPKPYAELINNFLQSIGSYDQTVSDLTRAALSNSFVFRASTGYRPFSGLGLEVLGGYTFVGLGGSLSGSELVNTLLAGHGAAVRVPSGGDTAQFPVYTTLHALQITVGWRWTFLGDRLFLRATLSYIQCLMAKSGVELPGRFSGTPLEAAVSHDFDAYLSPYLVTYTKVPLIGLSSGYRF